MASLIILESISRLCGGNLGSQTASSTAITISTSMSTLASTSSTGITSMEPPDRKTRFTERTSSGARARMWLRQPVMRLRLTRIKEKMKILWLTLITRTNLVIDYYYYNRYLHIG